MKPKKLSLWHAMLKLKDDQDDAEADNQKFLEGVQISGSYGKSGFCDLMHLL